MTTQTQQTSKVRQIIESRIGQLEIQRDMYERSPYWDCDEKYLANLGKGEFRRLCEERRPGIHNQMVTRYEREIRGLVSWLDRMDAVAASTSHGVMDLDRRIAAINKQLPEGQKLTGAENRGQAFEHIYDLLGQKAASKFGTSRGLPDDDPVYQKLQIAQDAFETARQFENSITVAKLAEKICHRQMTEPEYTAILEGRHPLVNEGLAYLAQTC